MKRVMVGQPRPAAMVTGSEGERWVASPWAAKVRDVLVETDAGPLPATGIVVADGNVRRIVMYRTVVADGQDGLGEDDVVRAVTLALEATEAREEYRVAERLLREVGYDLADTGTDA